MVSRNHLFTIIFTYDFAYLFQMVTSCGMQTLYGMFVNKPKPSNLSAELNAQLITVSITSYTSEV